MLDSLGLRADRVDLPAYPVVAELPARRQFDLSSSARPAPLSGRLPLPPLYACPDLYMRDIVGRHVAHPLDARSRS
jgi:hypothetical protein